MKRMDALFSPSRTYVFVPAIMGVGVLFWLASELRELVRAGRDTSLEKRAAIYGAGTARLTMAVPGELSAEERGLRPRPVYAILATVLCVGGVYVAIGSAANYFRAGGYVANIAWLLAVAIVTSLVATFYGVIAGVAFVQYQHPPTSIRRVLTNSLLTVPPSNGGAGGASWRVWAVFSASTAGAALLTMVVAISPHVVESFDSAVTAMLDGAVNHTWWVASDWIYRKEVVVPLAVLAGLAAMRCRVLLMGYGIATAAGFALSVALRDVVDRARPVNDILNTFDSYPSGHVTQSVLIAGLLPLAIATLTGRKRVILPMTLILGLAAVASAVGRVAVNLHWPTDVIGGALIGVALVSGVRLMIDTPSSHAGCRGCHWAPQPESSTPRGVIPLTMTSAQVIRLLAHLSAVVMALTLAVLAMTVGVPSNPDGTLLGAHIDGPVQLGLAGVLSLGALLAWKWDAAGAVVIAIAATGLGILAAMEYEPRYAILLTAGAMVPAVLLWLSWQHRRTAAELVTLAVVTLMLLVGTWAGATRVYDRYFGPTHPESSAPALPVDRVEWMWSGGLSARGITVVARLAPGYDTAALRLTGPGDRAVLSEPGDTDSDRIVRVSTDQLEPGTDYTYALVVDGQADSTRGVGKFRTPADGAMSFRFAVGSCARVGSNGAVFDAIAAEDPLFYLELGDLHYGNIESDSRAQFLAAFQMVLTRPGQAALYRQTPVSYIWDDHDFGGNDATASSAGASSARSVFREVVPSYPFALDGPIAQAYTVGRVRFVLTDSRSEAASDSVLGEQQRRWLIDEITASSKTHAVVVWGSSIPWIGEPAEGADSWAGRPAERREIANAIATAGVDNLVMVAGDAHMVAIDDGTNSDYSDDGGGGFPVLQAAALDRPGSVKGGPYSDGMFPGAGQYGIVDIADSGADVTVTLTGKRWDGTVLVTRQFTYPGLVS